MMVMGPEERAGAASSSLKVSGLFGKITRPRHFQLNSKILSYLRNFLRLGDFLGEIITPDGLA